MFRHPLLELRRGAIVPNHPKELTVEAVNDGKPGCAKPHRALRYRLEYWPQIEGRAADYFEQVGGSRLLLQRLAQLVQQSGVLDGDGSLTCKAGYQLDLLVTERADLLAINGDR